MLQRRVRYFNRKAVWLSRLGIAMIVVPWTIAIVLNVTISPRTLIERWVVPSIVLTIVEVTGMAILWFVSRHASRWPDAKPATWENVRE